MNPRFTIHDSRFTTWIVAGALFTIYVATLAPTVTLWDSGEFNAAIASLGIPHPPGTPLYILIANVWARMLPLPQALAVNLLSAVATAIACGLLGGLLARWTQEPTRRGRGAGSPRERCSPSGRTRPRPRFTRSPCCSRS